MESCDTTDLEVVGLGDGRVGMGRERVAKYILEQAFWDFEDFGAGGKVEGQYLLGRVPNEGFRAMSGR
jgi:hypothetical protein